MHEVYISTSRDLSLQFYPSGLLQRCIDKDSVLKTIPIQKKSNIDARNKNSTWDNPILCHLKLLFMILLTPSKIKQLLQNNKEQPKIMSIISPVSRILEKSCSRKYKSNKMK